MPRATTAAGTGSTVGKLRLLVIGPGTFQTYVLPEAGELTIGRADNAFVRIDDAQVSRRHATLIVAPDGIRVRDLGSSNGTRVRETRVGPSCTVDVQAGDVIDIGNTMLIVQSATTAQRPRHLWGHGFFEGRVEDECARAERSGGTFAVVRLHVEGEAGAQLATAVIEETLAQALRPGDPVAAYGPGEYEILVVDASPLMAEKLTRQLTAQLAARTIRGRVGIACYPTDGRAAEVLVQRACDAVRAGGDPRSAPNATPEVVVADGAMQRLHRLVERVAAGTISVLLLGETGVGKEVFAEALHRSSPRAARPFLRLNCAALAESLLESELFGHEKGAFTGAHAAKPGLLEGADGGTVFLDEIGELPVALQAKLLRVLENRVVQRVGGTRPRTIDVRFIAATNRDLEAEVARGRFRQDLFFRLNGISLMIPPLRERVGEIEPLARAFVTQACAGGSAPRLTAEALALLQRYAWPGNIRELRNVMERATLLCGGGEGAAIGPEHLPVEKMGTTLLGPHSGAFETAAPPEKKDLRAELASFERQRILDALEAARGNQTRAARALGMSRRTLVSRLEAYRLPRPRKARKD